MEPVVVAESLTKRFGKVLAVDRLSFVLEPGTITGFLGPNGAGKTTTRNQVSGVITLLAWGFVVSPLLFGLVPSVGRFMPSYAQDGLIGLTTNHLLPPAAGGIILIAWAAVLATAGLVVTARRDVA